MDKNKFKFIIFKKNNKTFLIYNSYNKTKYIILFNILTFLLSFF